ncbi:hypothetical protein SAMN04487905_102265 [Actinopolyspora xinjiangensis]|uniref:Uncharacterized protein n=1 Tax=Actinopolyspora xinjiangensis TaxID=405564 RepID=A0A1H0QL20_9ACTN|nr:hypothetical protein SAMN04487905_102265 [Actinopolyspora xinjiangensis]
MIGSFAADYVFRVGKRHALHLVIALAGMAAFVLLLLADHFVLWKYFPSGSALGLVQVVVFACLALIVRKQWKEKEKE